MTTFVKKVSWYLYKQSSNRGLKVAKNDRVNPHPALNFRDIKKLFFTNVVTNYVPSKNMSKNGSKKKYARKKVTRIIFKFDIGVQKKILRLFGQMKNFDLFFKKLRKWRLKFWICPNFVKSVSNQILLENPSRALAKEYFSLGNDLSQLSQCWETSGFVLI